MKSGLRNLCLALLVFAAARPVDASPISVLIGDKDGFGLGLTPGQEIPCLTSQAAGFVGIPDPWNPEHPSCLAPIHDLRNAVEQLATNGAQLTDTYSALYSGVEWDCPTGCTPNGETGTVVFPFLGQLASASISVFIGDFQSTLFNPMIADINGIPISFFFDDGFRNTSMQTIVLTPAMIEASNAAGQVTLFLDHHALRGAQGPAGSYDYVMFDYFELTGDQVPEPGTWLLLGTGLAALAARRRRASPPRR